MPTLKRFEDIRSWQSARELTKLVYEATKTAPFSKDFGLCDQIRRGAGSSMHNIAEGFGSGSDADFVRFLGYARRSIDEVQSQLYIALDQGYIEEDEFANIYQQAEETKRQINGFIGYLVKDRPTKKLREISEDYMTNTTSQTSKTGQTNKPYLTK